MFPLNAFRKIAALSYCSGFRPLGQNETHPRPPQCPARLGNVIDGVVSKEHEKRLKILEPFGDFPCRQCPYASIAQAAYLSNVWAEAKEFECLDPYRGHPPNKQYISLLYECGSIDVAQQADRFGEQARVGKLDCGPA